MIKQLIRTALLVCLVTGAGSAVAGIATFERIWNYDSNAKLTEVVYKPLEASGWMKNGAILTEGIAWSIQVIGIQDGYLSKEATKAEKKAYSDPALKRSGLMSFDGKMPVTITTQKFKFITKTKGWWLPRASGKVAVKQLASLNLAAKSLEKKVSKGEDVGVQATSLAKRLDSFESKFGDMPKIMGTIKELRLDLTSLKNASAKQARFNVEIEKNMKSTGRQLATLGREANVLGDKVRDVSQELESTQTSVADGLSVALAERKKLQEALAENSLIVGGLESANETKAKDMNALKGDLSFLEKMFYGLTFVMVIAGIILMLTGRKQNNRIDRIESKHTELESDKTDVKHDIRFMKKDIEELKSLVKKQEVAETLSESADSSGDKEKVEEVSSDATVSLDDEEDGKGKVLKSLDEQEPVDVERFLRPKEVSSDAA